MKHPLTSPAVVIAAAGTLAIGMALAIGPSAVADTSTGTVNGFSYGELQSTTVGATGCGTNVDGEPTMHVSKANTVLAGSERGVGGGSDAWVGLNKVGGATAAACSDLTYRGQPNAAGGIGASGGDIDSAFASAPLATGNYRIYVASLNLGSIAVAHSDDNGVTWANVPVQGGIPVDDREWIAAYGSATSLLTYHDITTDNIDVLRSDNGGTTYTQTSTAIPATNYKASNNELGNIVIDHLNTAGAAAGQFWAYQSFVAPSKNPGAQGSATFNEAFLAVSRDGGQTWADQPIPCTTAFGSNGLAHNFPNVSVAPNGTIYYAVSNDTNVYVATSSDHGSTWTCSGAVSTNTAQAIFPWIVATSAGVDLVYYGSPTTTNQTWYVYFAQNLGTGWGAPAQLMSVHTGGVCEGGVSCTGGRQLLDDFGIDTDQSGWAHIAYSHDAPNLGGSGTYTGYAVQTTGTAVGFPN
ncbi:MAG: hypothetical protein ACJ74O_12735 [Frankiaceae bacterium]